MRHLQRLGGLGLDIRRGLGDLANTPIRKNIPIAVVDKTSTGVWNEISTGVWGSRLYIFGLLGSGMTVSRP